MRDATGPRPSNGKKLRLAAAAGALAIGAVGAVVLEPHHAAPDHDPGSGAQGVVAHESPPTVLASLAKPPAPRGTTEAPKPSAAVVAVGRRIFFDPTLSEPKGTSCASCHDPALGFAGTHGSKLGVALGSKPNHYARRNTPSVLYLKYVRPFHFHWEEDAPLPDPRGGFFWDGRSDSIAELVQQPLLNPDEMGNPEPGVIAKKLLAAQYAADLRRELPEADASPEGTMTALGKAVEAFLLSDEMAPFSSKYDDYVRGKRPLNELEQRGLAAFKNPAKGNCASCHRLNDQLPKPERSLFSDYGFETVAVPRNRRLPANAKPTAFDLGVCERRTPSHASEDRLCGSFRTPSLRNVALRPSYMHNGVFTKLRDVVAFYATRGTNPKTWYPAGVVFDDLPEKFRQYVNAERAPYDRQTGDKPRLDDADIDAIVAFLNTLTDDAKSLHE
jgi:cytochrome c peroxidase